MAACSEARELCLRSRDRSRSESSLNAKISELESENRALKDTQIAQDTQIKRLLEEVAALKSRQEAVPA